MIGLGYKGGKGETGVHPDLRQGGGYAQAIAGWYTDVQ